LCAVPDFITVCVIRLFKIDTLKLLKKKAALKKNYFLTYERATTSHNFKLSYSKASGGRRSKDKPNSLRVYTANPINANSFEPRKRF
jgi:hypothetical protein